MPETKPLRPVSQEEAAGLIQNLYGFEVSARPLPGEYDHNFHVTARDGAAFVLKVMHPSRERSLIDLQCQALQHLAQRAPSLALPRVQLAKNGEAFSQVSLEDSQSHFVWLLGYLPGNILADVRPHTPVLMHSLGCLLGRIDHALQDFSHPAAKRELKWDSAQALWIREYLSYIENPLRRALVERALQRYETEVVPLLPKLRKSVIYGDANDYNALVNSADAKALEATSVIDFGDMHYGLVVSEPAIAAAYAILGNGDLLAHAAALVKGFHSVVPLDEAELSVLFPLIAMRLAVSVVNSAHRKVLVPDDPYVTVSEAPAWEALERLAKIHPRFAHGVFREACGLPASPSGRRLQGWLEANGKDAAPVLDQDLRNQPCSVFDLSVGSTFLGADPRNSETPVLAEAIQLELKRAGVSVGVGRYDEPRLLYTAPRFGGSDNPTDERRTVHLGLDLFVPAGSNVHAPLDGFIHSIADNASPLDYGPLVILKHSAGDAEEFFTLYGHLSRESTQKLSLGQSFTKGQTFAQIGAVHENGGWPPHLHFQVIGDLLDLDVRFPGVARASEREIWKSLCPDPNLLLEFLKSASREKCRLLKRWSNGGLCSGAISASPTRIL